MSKQYPVQPSRVRWALAQLQQAGIQAQLQRTPTGYVIVVADDADADAAPVVGGVTGYQAHGRKPGKRNAWLRTLWAGIVAGSWFVAAGAALYLGVALWFAAGMAALGAFAWFWTRRNEGLYRQADAQHQGWLLKRKESWLHLLSGIVLSVGLAAWLVMLALGAL